MKKQLKYGLMISCAVVCVSAQAHASKFLTSLLKEEGNIQKLVRVPMKHSSTDLPKDKNDTTKKIDAIFKGSLPKKTFCTKDLVDSGYIKNFLRNSIVLNEEGTFFKPKHKMNVNEASRVQKDVKQFSLLRKPPYTPDFLNFVFDRREKVEAPHVYPWNLTGYITSSYEDDKLSRGTGILVGPRHVLTAAHVVSSDGVEARDVNFTVGMSDRGYLFNVSVAKKFVHPNYLLKKDDNFDYALLCLNRDIGHELGWSALTLLDEESYWNEKFKVVVSGYPGYKSFKSYMPGFSQEQDMFKMEGFLTRFEPYRLHYDLDTSGGQSGSGICRQTDDVVMLYGIHTRGHGNYGNNGVRVNQELSDFIKDKIIQEQSDDGTCDALKKN